MSLVIPVDPSRARLWLMGLSDSSSLLTSVRRNSSSLYIVRLSDGLKGTMELLKEFADRVLTNTEEVDLVVWRSHTVLIEQWSREQGAVITSRDSTGWRWALKGEGIKASRFYKLAVSRYAQELLKI